jgi:hypothetical protein
MIAGTRNLDPKALNIKQKVSRSPSSGKSWLFSLVFVLQAKKVLSTSFAFFHGERQA